jgi:hypothetical protein
MSPDLAAEPFALSVRPHQHAVLDLATEARLAAYAPRNEAYSIIVRSADGVRIVAERLVTVAPGTPGAGVGVSAGSAVASHRLVADVTVTDPAGTDAVLVLLNPSARTIVPVKIFVMTAAGMAPPAVNPSIELQPGARVSLKLGELGRGDFTVIVESTGLIVGERELVLGADRAVAPAVPDAATAEIPEIALFEE